MSEQIGILFRDGKSTSKIDNSFATVDFDATLSEGHSWRANITENPVESGSDVSDNIRTTPDELTLVGMVTNTPFSDAQGGGNVLIDNSGTNYVEDIIGGLNYLRKKRVLSTVYTRYVQYPNMAIASIDFTRDASNTNAVIFTIGFKEVVIVDTQTVDVPAGISKKLDKKAGDGTQKKTEPQKAGGAKQPVGETQPGSVLSEIGPKAIQGAKDAAAAVANAIKGI